jgi:hypothetical protein
MSPSGCEDSGDVILHVSTNLGQMISAKKLPNLGESRLGIYQFRGSWFPFNLLPLSRTLSYLCSNGRYYQDWPKA